VNDAGIARQLEGWRLLPGLERPGRPRRQERCSPDEISAIDFVLPTVKKVLIAFNWLHANAKYPNVL